MATFTRNLGKCRFCKRKVYQDILYFDICGVCGLYLQNKELGIHRKKFQGEIAEEFRIEALEYYKKTKQIYKYE